MLCKICMKETSNKKFCSKKCSSDWNNSNAMTLNSQKKRGQKNSEGLKTPKNIFDVSSRTAAKIMRRLNVGCFVCGWNEASCDIHHIVPKKDGGSNENNNLTYICPNCHRLAHSGKLLEMKNFDEMIGEKWREHYYAHA